MNRTNKEELERGKPFPGREWEEGEWEELMKDSAPGVDSESYKDYLKEKEEKERAKQKDV